MPVSLLKIYRNIAVPVFGLGMWGLRP
jgi:hypothetical protein